MGFKISTTEAITLVKAIDKAANVIDHLEKMGGKNKILYPGFKEELKNLAKVWREGLDLENFDEWKET